MSFTKLLRTAMVAASIITQGTLTAQTPGLSHTATWNNAGVTFIAQTLDVTDTASAAGSLLARWRVGGVTQFSVSKAGALNLAGGITATTASFTTGAFSGDLSVATNKFTVAAATGNTVLAGSLTVGAASFSGSLTNGITMNSGTATDIVGFVIQTAATQRALCYATSTGLDFYTSTAIPMRLGTNGSINLTIASGGAATFSSTVACGALTTNGGLQTFGANDSGGAGYRMVRVPNV
jgi:hypothetical protein